MFRPINVLRTAVVLGAALLVVLQTGCAAPAAKAEPVPVAAEEGEIPITTASEEALAVFLEGREMFENIRFGKARELFTQAIEKDPDFALAYLSRAIVAASTQDRKSDLERAVALAPNVSEGERLLVEANQALFLDSNPVRAIAVLEQLAEKYPNDKRTHGDLGSNYYFSNEYHKAIVELQKAVEIDKDFAPSYNMLGYACREIGEYEQAEEAFNNYIRLIPAEPNPYDSMGELLMKLGRYEEAIEHFQKAVELDPTFAGSQQSIGINLVWLGKSEEGRAAIAKAIEMYPGPAGKVAGQGALARAYLYEGNHEDAFAALDKAVQLAKDENLPRRAAFYHLGKGACCIEMGDLDRAEQCLAACRSQLESADIIPYYKNLYSQFALWNEALIATKRQDFEAALAKAEEFKAGIVTGGDPKAQTEDYHGLLGLIHLEKGAYEEAIANFLEANQEDPYHLYYLAKAKSGVGDEEAAAELFRKVAHWNVDGYPYALVRAKALAALKE